MAPTTAATAACRSKSLNASGLAPVATSMASSAAAWATFATPPMVRSAPAPARNRPTAPFTRDASTFASPGVMPRTAPSWSGATRAFTAPDPAPAARAFMGFPVASIVRPYALPAPCPANTAGPAGPAARAAAIPGTASPTAPEYGRLGSAG